MIELFSAPTPNALKVRIALEEMELPYTLRAPITASPTSPCGSGP